jgi:MFS transporter, CP family, cyanate transporter
LRSAAPRSLFRLVVLWLAGADLRLTLLALPPLLPLIHRDLKLDETAIGALTGLPVLLLGLMAIPGSLLIVRIGARRALISGLLLIATASALRGVGPSAAVLFGMTVLMGVGVAVIQPALPSLVSIWFAGEVGLATAVYANGLVISEILSASLTIPLVLPLVGGSWALSFVVWSVPVYLTAALIAAATPHVPRDSGSRRADWWPDWRDARTWQIGLLNGGAGIMYFGANAFVPDYLEAIGRGELVETCLTFLNAGQLPASVLLMFLARRLSGRKAPLIAVSLLSFIGIAGILTPTAETMALGAGIIGFCAAFFLVSSLALPPLLAAPGDVHRLSAGAFTVGYTASFLMPLLGGIAWDVTHNPATAFAPVGIGAATVLLMAITLRLVGRKPAGTEV